MFRIDYKNKEVEQILHLANILAEEGYTVTLIVIELLALPNSIAISSKINFDYLSNYMHLEKAILPLDIYRDNSSISDAFMPTVDTYFSMLKTDILYFSAVDVGLFKKIVEALPLEVNVVVKESLLYKKENQVDEEYLKKVSKIPINRDTIEEQKKILLDLLVK